jgi:hypothetical protein
LKMHVVEMRMELRLKILQHAGFNSHGPLRH